GRLFWIPILAAPFFFNNPILAIVIFYLLVKICETMTDPSYSTLLADIVPSKKLGTFISKRHRIISTFGMISLVLGGLWLKQFPKESPIGFALMFAFGTILAVLATLVMTKIKEPKYKDHDHHSIKEFFVLDGHMRKFVTFSTAFFFSYMLASPFFAVYMLENLQMSYLYFGIASAISTLAQITTAHYVGKLTDKYGDKPLAIMGHVGTALVPLLFLAITKQNLWLIIPVQIYSGMVWATADISKYNLALSLSDPKRRAMQIAEYNLYGSIALVIAPLLGGWMTEHIQWILAGIPLVFIISAMLRFLSSLLLLRVKEPRAKQEYPVIYVFREAMHFHPNKGIQYGMRIVKKITGGLVR
ncbi:MFS transporter, partial [Candidatus Woesearchaeota archaeon]|nr:MFS transporter [Candidatus Woesearchaeota archaeon]